MALNSINTNSAAIVALQSLNRTNTQLQSTQNRVSTGFRIDNAREDGAGFAIAQGLRGNIKGYEAIREQLSKAKGTMTVANEAARSISDALGDVRAVLTKLADDNTTGDQRDQYIADYDILIADITRYIDNALFGGINLLDSTTDVEVISNLDGDPLTLRAHDIPTGVTANLTTVTDAASARALIAATTGGLALAESAIGTAMGLLGADARTLEKHDTYVSLLVDATTEGLGAIVDADLAKESAKLQALQIRQQLGTQTLSIANQSPNVLLSLFGN